MQQSEQRESVRSQGQRDMWSGRDMEIFGQDSALRSSRFLQLLHFHGCHCVGGTPRPAGSLSSSSSSLQNTVGHHRSVITSLGQTSLGRASQAQITSPTSHPLPIPANAFLAPLGFAARFCLPPTRFLLSAHCPCLWLTHTAVSLMPLSDHTAVSLMPRLWLTTQL